MTYSRAYIDAILLESFMGLLSLQPEITTPSLYRSDVSISWSHIGDSLRHHQFNIYAQNSTRFIAYYTIEELLQ